ncbi:MAG: PEP-CTERM sorting domain-containing protein [Pirellulales bacterium]
MRMWLLLIVVSFLSSVLRGQETQFHWDANAKYDLDIPDLDLADKILSERGRIGGILQDTEVKVVGNWDVEASATLKGENFKLKADAYVKADGWASVGLSNAKIDASMNWNDRYRLFGEGVLPFNQTITKWRFHANFENGDDERQRFYYWDVYGKITVNDPAAAESFGTVIEYFRTNREDVDGIGSRSVSGLATFTYNLDDVRGSDYKLNIGIQARTEGSWLRILAGNTFELTAIEFPDGSTPEDHGFQIVFDSGARSPNIGVPEPSTAVLTAIGAICAAVVFRRSRRGDQRALPAPRQPTHARMSGMMRRLLPAIALLCFCSNVAVALNPLDFAVLDDGGGFTTSNSISPANIVTTPTGGTLSFMGTTYQAVMVPQISGPDIAVFTFSDIINARFTVSGSNPIALLSHLNIDIGIISNGSAASGSTPGLGGASGGAGGTPTSAGQGPGGGAPGGAAPATQLGGGGGGHAAAGQQGGSNPCCSGGAAGVAYPSLPTILRGGSGGGGNGGALAGGGGGGAFEIGAVNSVRMGGFEVNGGAGATAAGINGGGSGSGGSVYVHGRQVIMDLQPSLSSIPFGSANFEANGASPGSGLGGSSSGSGGRIVIENVTSVDGQTGAAVGVEIGVQSRIQAASGHGNNGQILLSPLLSVVKNLHVVLDGQPINFSRYGVTSFDVRKDLQIGQFLLNSPASVTLGIDNPLEASAKVAIDETGVFQTRNFQQTIADLTGEGLLQLDAGGRVTIASDDTLHLAFAGQVIGPGTLAKSGRGTVIRESNLTLGGSFINSAGTFVIDGAALTAPSGISNAAGAEMRMVSIGASIVAPTLTNAGQITGSGTIDAALNNQAGGTLRVLELESQRVIGGPSTNSGTISLLGGTLEFTHPLTNAASTGLITGRGTLLLGNAGMTNQGFLAFSGGTTDIVGDVIHTGAGRLSTVGGAVTSFFGDFTHNASTPILTGAGSRTVFLGTQTGGGSFAGGGTVEYAGALLPGNSPATVSYGGDVTFGSEATLHLELGGTVKGTDYDSVDVAGALALSGALNVSLIDGFVPQATHTFDLLDWGTLAGVFDAITLPALSSELQWDTSQLYTTGALSVSLAGDYNGNGLVDAADYTVWRDGLGGTTYTQLHYDQWKQNFGAVSPGIGAGNGSLSRTAVPEPSGKVLAAISMLCFAAVMGHLGRQARSVANFAKDFWLLLQTFERGVFMHKCINLALVFLMLPAAGCGPSQKDIDRTKRLNELSEQRAASAILEYLEEKPEPPEAQEASGQLETQQ